VTLPGAGRIASAMPLRRAIIDIGSNTVRMVVYGGPPRAPAILHNEKVTARLGKGVGETGKLSQKAMAAALAGLARYRILIETSGIDDVTVVATAAVRDAANGPQFLDAIRAIGLEPRLMSGEDEALTSANGVMAAFPGAKGMVADLGGGSLELVDIDNDHCAHGVSLPLGTLLLPALRKGGPAQFNRKVGKVLQKAELGAGQGLPLFLVGGSCRAFACYALDATDWPLDDPHGFELDAETAIALAGTLVRRRSKVPLQVPGLSASRLASLTDASALIAVLADRIRPSSLVFSSWGLREGVLYHSLAPADRRLDPALAGIAQFAQGLGIEASLAAMLADWCAPIIPPIALQGADDRENLRLAATMLSLAASRIEPNLRVEHATDWALRKRWIGIDHEERAMLAAALLTNCARPVAAMGLGRLAPAESLQQAAIWGQAIRLGRRLSGGLAAALSVSWLSVTGDRLQLAVRQPYAALFTDSIEKDLRALARMLGLKPVFTALPQSGDDGEAGPNGDLLSAAKAGPL
jgi:exopolyphosphatase/guanosine-5'-triphosphate,3'-diphosphate pyrophosphatase